MGVLENEYVGTRWVRNLGAADQEIYRIVKMPDGKLGFLIEATWTIVRFGLSDEQVHAYIIGHSIRRH